MRASYSIEPLKSDSVDRAYALMNQIAPALTMRGWRDFCRDASASRVGGRDSDDGEQIGLAVNSQGYIKGLCIYSVRNHWNYGRLIDVPFFFVASVADAKGVARELLRFLLTACNSSVCSGVRFWQMNLDTWDRRLNNDEILRTDHGIFMPAIAGAAEIDSISGA